MKPLARTCDFSKVRMLPAWKSGSYSCETSCVREVGKFPAFKYKCFSHEKSCFHKVGQSPASTVSSCPRRLSASSSPGLPIPILIAVVDVRRPQPRIADFGFLSASSSQASPIPKSTWFGRLSAPSFPESPIPWRNALVNFRRPHFQDRRFQSLILFGSAFGVLINSIAGPKVDLLLGQLSASSFPGPPIPKLKGCAWLSWVFPGSPFPSRIVLAMVSSRLMPVQSMLQYTCQVVKKGHSVMIGSSSAV